MARQKTKTARLEMVVPEYLKSELKALADKKGITLTEYVQDLIKEAVFKDKQK
jgi:hypothetical protein